MEDEECKDCKKPVKYQASTRAVELWVLTTKEFVERDDALPSDRLFDYTSVSSHIMILGTIPIPLAVM